MVISYEIAGPEPRQGGGLSVGLTRPPSQTFFVMETKTRETTSAEKMMHARGLDLRRMVANDLIAGTAIAYSLKPKKTARLVCWNLCSLFRKSKFADVEHEFGCVVLTWSLRSSLKWDRKEEASIWDLYNLLRKNIASTQKKLP